MYPIGVHFKTLG